MADLSHYRAVFLIDAEYRPTLFGHVQPVCLVAKDMVTGQEYRAWTDDADLSELPALPDGPDVLYVSYSAPAEWSCWLAWGWNLPSNILDLHALHRVEKNGFQESRNGKMGPTQCSLLRLMEEKGLSHLAISEARKKAMRDLILRGGPYTPEQKAAILDYCALDVRDLEVLLPTILPDCNLPQALMLGDFTRVLAWADWNGIPVDIQMCRRLRASWPKVLEMFARNYEETHHYGVFRFEEDGRPVLDEALYADLIVRNGLESEWPRSKKSQKFSKSVSKKKKEQPNLRTMASKYEYFRGLFEVVELLQDYKVFELPLGPDGRWRAPNIPWQQKTGRITPAGANLFRMHSWFRYLITPPPGRAVAYVDLKAAEYGIGAALSGDPNMMATYIDVLEGRAQKPYLITGKKLGILPADADCKHPKYKMCKAAELAMFYGQTPQGCSQANNIPLQVAEDFHEGHRGLYRTYWDYVNWRIREARAEGFIKTPFGYSMNVHREVSDNTLLNWSMQATCAEILRLATSRMVDEGLSICATVHDSVLLEADLETIDQHVEVAKECWRWASEKVLKFRLDADAKVVRYPDRYTDEDGSEVWSQLIRFLEEIEKLTPGTGAEANFCLPVTAGLHEVSDRS
jgi:DNA polymerase I